MPKKYKSTANNARLLGGKMPKNCFVIMGYGVKDGFDLDLIYNKIIRPTIISNRLVPYPMI